MFQRNANGSVNDGSGFALGWAFALDCLASPDTQQGVNVASDKKRGQKAYCAGITAAGQDCRRIVGQEDYCRQHQPKMLMAADYAGLDFKEMLAACPLENIELTREWELPRDLSF